MKDKAQVALGTIIVIGGVAFHQFYSLMNNPSRDPDRRARMVGNPGSIPALRRARAGWVPTVSCVMPKLTS
jgi:hypothetical protein